MWVITRLGRKGQATRDSWTAKIPCPQESGPLGSQVGPVQAALPGLEPGPLLLLL